MTKRPSDRGPLRTKGPRIRGLLAARETEVVVPEAEPAEVQAPAVVAPAEVDHVEAAVGVAQDSAGKDDVLPTHVGGNLVLLSEQTLAVREAKVGLDDHRLLPHGRPTDRWFAIVEEPEKFQVTDLEVDRSDVLHDLLAPARDELGAVDLAWVLEELELAHHQLSDLTTKSIAENALGILIVSTGIVHCFHHHTTDVVQFPTEGQEITFPLSHDNTSSCLAYLVPLH